MKIDTKTCVRVGVTVFILFLAITYWHTVANFFVAAVGASTPLIIGGIVAYLVNILMGSYERLYFPKASNKFILSTRRPLCLVLAFITLTVIVALVISLIVPQLTSAVNLIINLVVEKAPIIAKDIIAKIDGDNIIADWIADYLASIDWKSKITQIINVITSGIGNVLDIVIGTLSSVFGGIVTALISVIFSVYLLSGKEKIASQLLLLSNKYLKKNVTNKITHVLSVMNGCFKRYIIGQCTEAVILGLLCTVGMLLLRIPYATMVGALIAFTALIPIAGAYIGAFVGAFMILTVSPVKALIFLIFLVILQQLEGNIIYPRVVGSSIGLPGIWVLASVTVGGGIMGIAGMLLGVPLAATAYKLLREDVMKKDNKSKKDNKEQIEKYKRKHKPTSLR